MAINAFVQLSLGRIPVAVDEASSIRDMKKKLRLDYPEIAHVPLGKFRIYLNGTYLSDESVTVKDAGIEEGSTLHFIRKTACEEAAVNTERVADE